MKAQAAGVALLAQQASTVRARLLRDIGNARGPALTLNGTTVVGGTT